MWIISEDIETVVKSKGNKSVWDSVVASGETYKQWERF